MNAFACYKQKCKLAPFHLFHPVACSFHVISIYYYFYLLLANKISDLIRTRWMQCWKVWFVGIKIWTLITRSFENFFWRNLLLSLRIHPGCCCPNCTAFRLNIIWFAAQRLGDVIFVKHGVGLTSDNFQVTRAVCLRRLILAVRTVAETNRARYWAKTRSDWRGNVGHSARSQAGHGSCPACPVCWSPL